MDWKHTSTQAGLSEEFIREHAEQLHWESICKYQTLSEDFIEELYERVHWTALGENQPLSFEFIKKYYYHFSYFSLLKNKKLSFDTDRLKVFYEKEIEEKQQVLEKLYNDYQSLRQKSEKYRNKATELQKEIRILL